MKRIVWLLFVLIGATTAIACTGPGGSQAISRGQAPVPTPTHHRTYCVGWSPTQANARPQAIDPRPLVWILDGAGDLKGCSNALSWANMLAGNPVEIETFTWSHGYRRLLRDQTDMGHAREQGKEFARAVLARKAQEPGRRVVIVAHSAGCAVALAAGDVLPRDVIDRVILLAPSVSTTYDTRPTLWSATEGVDVFCSKKDWVALGFVTRIVGTTDKFAAPAAGRWGFQPKPEEALTDVECQRLRQHFWSEAVEWTGHDGGHHGMHEPDFVIAYLFPLMTGK